MEALAALDAQEPTAFASDTPSVPTERATLSLRERSPIQVQIDSNPNFMEPEAVGTPRGDQMRVWAEALDCTSTTPTEPIDLRSRQPQPARVNQAATIPTQTEPFVSDLMVTLIGKVDELQVGLAGTIAQGQATLMA
jgi:hypothetical protein